ncbi:Phytanoyl-CoA dioxygenase (PhyH) [Novymonas esmeraldas]|uniref:Phytanoyl-CoA dioxygenase (PhyH) n=1 Tax=Novymonas esmeraldas TaxID=1808958 RepID=A0AAW0EXR5_9TRYP
MSSGTGLRVRRIADTVSTTVVEEFRRDGFVVHADCIFADDAASALAALRSALEDVINGRYDTPVAPTNVSALPKDLLVDGVVSFDAPIRCRDKGAKPRNTIHLVNAWRSSHRVRELVTAPELGDAVVRLMGWEQVECRVAQDQVWVKPPGSGALSFHRDTPYLDFAPKEVCTLWITFDDTRVPGVGTLQYCRGSHRWTGVRRGSARQFYNADYTELLRIAAHDESLADAEEGHSTVAAPLTLDLVSVTGCSGCRSFHNGNTWHGSGPNESSQWRRGIGIHYIRGDATFSDDCGRMWQPFRHPDGSAHLSDELFPPVTRGQRGDASTA